MKIFILTLIFFILLNKKIKSFDFIKNIRSISIKNTQASDKNILHFLSENFWIDFLIFIALYYMISSLLSVKKKENYIPITQINDVNILDDYKIIPQLGKCSTQFCPNYSYNSLPIDNNFKLGENNEKYHTSNLMCSDGVHDRGCVCLTNKSFDLLANRGQLKNIDLDYKLNFLNTDQNKSFYENDLSPDYASSDKKKSNNHTSNDKLNNHKSEKNDKNKNKNKK